MIGGRLRPATLRGVAAIVAVGLVFGARPPDPASADPTAALHRAAGLTTTARSTDETLSQLAQLLTATVDDARRGAALTVAGDDSPGPSLVAAAHQLEEGAQRADLAQVSLVRLRGAAAAVNPGRTIPQLSLTGEGLLTIAGQLRISAEQAKVFVERRHATDTVLRALADALAALEGDQPQQAVDLLDGSAASLDLLRAWESPPITLALWLTTTDELVAAVREIARATLAGDDAAAAEAATRYAVAAETARSADVSLALTLSEGGASITSLPLRRLTDGLAELSALRDAIAALVEGG